MATNPAGGGVLSEYIFKGVDYDNDEFWVVKEFFNSINISKKFLYGLSLLTDGVGFCFDEAYFHFPDLDDSDDELRFDGLIFGVFDGEIIVCAADGYSLVRLACEEYLQLHPEDTAKVNELLVKLPA
ncbi:ribonuclease toxin immunity protein CdiI [Pseudomonas sp. K1(2024)]|uniref:Ribonuclease toxin immunity protein CdiI n=1 Tax=Pseudomonas boreofloridensis TaxID=3064348 RepID=A0ABV4Z9P8_9PSED|nr:ribonuclease toxin immunity protein CdiI [Pseudomonas sp. K13]MDO7902971.1 ribonuclease toxin immunity protein CdiI [Pseudomonas sp. K13]